jgi:hypothetical protein
LISSRESYQQSAVCDVITEPSVEAFLATTMSVHDPVDLQVGQGGGSAATFSVAVTAGAAEGVGVTAERCAGAYSKTRINAATPTVLPMVPSTILATLISTPPSSWVAV